MESYQTSEHSSSQDCAIGLIASPRQTGLTYSGPKGDMSQPGSGTTFVDRGAYQTVGHTALFARKGNTYMLVEGLVPSGLVSLFKTIVIGKPGEGKWQDDSSMLHDPTTRKTEIKVSAKIADKFIEYFTNIKKTADKNQELNQFVLRPTGVTTSGNCVFSAMTVLINFFYENQKEFSPGEWAEIEKRLDQIMSDTANKEHCMQGNLIANISNWKENVNLQRLSKDIVGYLQSEVNRLSRNISDAETALKIRVAQLLIAEIKHLHISDANSKDDQMYAKMINIIQQVQVFAYYKRDELQVKEPETRKGWDEIKIRYNLNIQITARNLALLETDLNKLNRTREYREHSSTFELLKTMSPLPGEAVEHDQLPTTKAPTHHKPTVQSKGDKDIQISKKEAVPQERTLKILASLEALRDMDAAKMGTGSRSGKLNWRAIYKTQFLTLLIDTIKAHPENFERNQQQFMQNFLQNVDPSLFKEATKGFTSRVKESVNALRNGLMPPNYAEAKEAKNTTSNTSNELPKPTF